MENEKFDYKNALKTPYVYYMLMGLAVGMIVPKLLNKKPYGKR